MKQAQLSVTKKQNQILFSIAGFLFFGLSTQLPLVQRLDFEILRAVHAINWKALTYGFLPFTLIGSIEFSGPAILLLSIWLYRRRELQKAYLCLAALLVATGIELWLKHTLGQPEPPKEFLGRFPVAFHGLTVRTDTSFPSGHTLRPTILACLAFSWLPVLGKKIPAWVYVVIPAASGLSMVYYGYHWLSDTIGGWWLGILVWASAIYLDEQRSG